KTKLSSTRDSTNRGLRVRPSSSARLQGLADFPVMSEGINDSSQAPAVLVADRVNDGGAGADGALESRIRIVHDHHHPYRAAAQRFRAVMQVFRRFVGHPEFSALHRQASDHRSVRSIQAE